MCIIWIKFQNIESWRTDIWGCWRTIWVFFDFIPKSIPFGTSWSISSYYILWICDPKGCYSSISLKHIPNLFSSCYKIVLYDVICFNSILQEYRMTKSIIANILFDSQKVDSMDCNASSIIIMNWISSNIWSINIAIQVEMYWISSFNNWLTSISEFWIRYSSWSSHSGITMNH